MPTTLKSFHSIFTLFSTISFFHTNKITPFLNKISLRISGFVMISQNSPSYTRGLLNESNYLSNLYLMNLCDFGRFIKSCFMNLKIMNQV